MRAAWLTARRAGLRRVVRRLERRLRLRLLDPCLAGRMYPRSAPARSCFEPAPGAQRQLLGQLAALRAGSPLGRAWDRQRALLTLLNQQALPLAVPVSWMRSPIADPLWGFSLHSWEWAWPVLSDGRGAQEFLTLWRDWLDHVPVGRGVAWEPYPTSRRLAVWAAAWHVLGGDMLLLGAIAQHADYMLHHLERDLDNNHLVANARGLAWAGLLFSTLPRAERWRHVGLGVLWAALAAQVRSDGGHVENSASYHVAVWLDGLETALLAQASGHDVPQPVWECLARMASFAAALCRPDGRLPLLNDSSEDDPLPASAVLDLMSASVGRQFLPGGRVSGALREAASCDAFAESGYVVLRAGAGREATYLVFDAGDLGPAHCPGHGHADALSIELWGRGQGLIVDPGTYQYPAGHWRDYFRGTAAHSTATVDGQEQSSFAGAFRVADMARGRLVAASSGGGQAEATGEHDGYLRLADPVIHRRRVCLCGPDQVVVEDTFGGAAEHHVVLRFHLAPCEVRLAGASGGLATYPGGVMMELQVTSTKPGRLTVEDGWSSNTWYVKQRSPVVTYSLSGRLPITVFTRMRIA